MKELLSPQEQRRMWADQLLFQLNCFDKLDKITYKESLNFIENKEHFVPALISYWARISHTAFKERMRGLGGCSSQSKFKLASSSPYDELYPVEERYENPMEIGLFLGIGKWLAESIGPESRETIFQLLAILDYNDCEDTVVEILRNMGEVAKEALPKLIDYVIKKGPKHSPTKDCEIIAKIIGQDNVFLERMAAELEDTSQIHKILAYCSIFNHVQKPTSVLIGSLLKAIYVINPTYTKT